MDVAHKSLVWYNSLLSVGWSWALGINAPAAATVYHRERGKYRYKPLYLP